jgi:hypothetical protein
MTFRMPEESWYETVTGPDLQQGDLVLEYGVVVAQAPDHVTDRTESRDRGDTEISVTETIRDIVVMTQSCDLENDKVTEVLAASVIGWDAWVRTYAESGQPMNSKAQRKWREKLVRGEFPSLSLLRAHDRDPHFGWSVVDFRKLFTIDKQALALHVADMGDRLRLRPPYREHLSQAFARYFMRVGLPLAARDFESHPAIEVT